MAAKWLYQEKSNSDFSETLHIYRWSKFKNYWGQ